MLENDPLKAIAEKYLARSIGDPSAHFRKGQWEAIDAVTNERKKLIVVQRTGWGKSSVYFISTEQLIDALSTNKSQFKAWIKQVIQTGRLHKLSKPVRYQVKSQCALPGF